MPRRTHLVALVSRARRTLVALLVTLWRAAVDRSAALSRRAVARSAVLSRRQAALRSMLSQPAVVAFRLELPRRAVPALSGAVCLILVSALITGLTLTGRPRPVPAAAATPTTSSRPPVGPDVSGHQHHEGAPIDWDRARAAGGVGFAFVKATEGATFVNTYFRSDFEALGERQIIRGAYHYARPEWPLSDADDEAAAYLATAGRLEAAGDLPPVLDLEESGGLSPDQLRQWATRWLERVEAATGRRPMIYTFPNFWRDAMAGTSALSQYPLWLARYETAEPALIGGWERWTFWQYTATSSLAGVPGQGRLDMNTFNGSVAELRELARLRG